MTALGWTLLPDTIQNVPLFIVLGSMAALLISGAKGGFGGSVGLLSVPMMIYACGGAASAESARLAAGIMLPVLIACDMVAMASWWRQWAWRPVWLMLPGAIVGMAAGGAAFAAFAKMEAGGQAKAANAVLMMGIGVIALGFVAIQAVRMLRTRPLAFRPVFWQGTCFGLAAGFTSTLAHAAGPITTMYLLPQRMPKAQYVATTVLYYWMGNLMKLGVYIPMRRLDRTSLAASLIFMPAVVVGTLMGVVLHRRIGQRSFDMIVYALLSLAGLKLILDSAGVLWA
ncbi:MAG TPA: sulfite exporter TauE/SafE family protein [Phycisphaerae bacterium]|nr:sulfite exporter TauE/SafE family protein [Phycisphaerae bacterium]